jgi:Peptidase family M48
VDERRALRARRERGSRVVDERALLSVELALGALVVTVALLVAEIALDALRFHAHALWDVHTLGLRGAGVIALGVLDGVVLARGAASVSRALRAQRRFARDLPVVGAATVHGHDVRVFAGASLEAFCAGLLRPATYVSTATLRELGEPELRAILAHEAHHRARRDPLRLLIARAFADAFRPLQPFAGLAEREAALADLAADAAAVRRLGDVTPLASALVRFDDIPAHGVAPERVDHLVRERPPETVPAWLLAAAVPPIAVLAAVAAPMVLSGWHPDLDLPMALEAAALVAVCAPACLAVRRAGACLRPAA